MSRRDNGLGDEGAKALAGGLEHLGSLQHLNIRYVCVYAREGEGVERGRGA